MPPSPSEERSIRLTLRTLLAYLDDTLPPADARQIGLKLASNPSAQELVERIKKVTRRRGLSTPPPIAFSKNTPSDPNVVAGYLSDTLSPEMLAEFESICLESDIHLAEVAACHQILTLVLCEQIRVPPTSYRRMYALVKGRESIHNREPSKIIPIGRSFHGPDGSEDLDADAPYLSGLPVISTPQPLWKRAARWSIAFLALVGFLLSVWIVWPRTPKLDSRDKSTVAVAPNTYRDGVANPPTSTTTKTTPGSVEPSPTKGGTAPDPVATIKPVLPIEPRPELEILPAPLEVSLTPPVRPVELVPDRIPVKNGEVTIGALDAAETTAVLYRAPNAANWTAMSTQEPRLRTGVRVVSLPGYKPRFKLDGGLSVELWGNLPELLPLPVSETTAMFHVPYDGYAADLTLSTGRLYFSTTQTNGAKIRLRIRNEIWDITLPDAKTEIAIEATRRLVPGRLPEPPETVLAVHVIKGNASLKVRDKEIPRIAAGETVFWSNQGRGLEGPVRPEATVGRGSAYFAKIPIYPVESVARPALESLDEFARRLAESGKVRASLAELVREQTDITPRTLADARLGVFSYAAVGDFEVLTDFLNDSDRHPIRQTAVAAMRSALAVYDDREEEIRKLFERKLSISIDQAGELIRMLRGASAQDRQTPEFLDGLVSGLSSPTLAIREVSFAVLVLDVDPASQKIARLMQYNAGAPAEIREPLVRAWSNRILELKKPARDDKEKSPLPAKESEKAKG